MALERLQHLLREEINRLDKDLYQVLYSYVRRGSANANRTPPWYSSLGQPPFESPIVVQLLRAYFIAKNASSDGSSSMRTPNSVYEFFIAWLDSYRLVQPNMFEASVRRGGDDAMIAEYRLCYARWFVNCYAPRQVKTFKEYRPSTIFGADFLSLLFALIGRNIATEFGSQSTRPSSVTAERLLAFLDDFKLFLSHFDGHLPPCGSGSGVPKCLASSPDEELYSKFKASKCPRRSSIITRKAKQEEEHVDQDIPDQLWYPVLAEYEHRQQLRRPHVLLDSMLELMPRDQLARMEEQNGKISIHLINNDLSTNQDRQKLLWLLELQNVITQQLPKMPLEYVSRIVWDYKHKNIVMVKNGSVIAVICFRTFFEQSFSEIVFCAVVANEQVKGYGTHLMNHLKDYHVQNGIYDLLTYADELAVGYFQKQGFSKRIHVDSSRYEGYVKEYEGAAFMACQLFPNVVYTLLSTMIKKQKELIQLMAEHINVTADTKRVYQSPFVTDDDDDDDGLPPCSVEQIAGLGQGGGHGICRRSMSTDSSDQLHSETLAAKLKFLLSRLRAHPSAWPFREPVNGIEVPDYYGFIKYPMDLRTMAERLKNGYYCHVKLFKADVLRMLDNCRRFNHISTKYYKAAVTLERAFLSAWNREDMDSWHC